MKATPNENSLQTAVRWGGNALLVGGAFALVSYVMCWPFFILHAIWLTATGQHQKRNEIMAILAASWEMRFLYGVGGVLMSIPVMVLVALVMGQIDPSYGGPMWQWWDKNCGDVMLWLFVYPIVGVAVAAAVFTMISGIVQSVRASKTKQKPQVSGKTLVIVFYLLALPMWFLMACLHCSGSVGIEERGTLFSVEHIILMFTAFLVFRKFLPKLMVNSTASVHKHASWILAILMYPVYYHLLIKVGFFDMIYSPIFSMFE